MWAHRIDPKKKKTLRQLLEKPDFYIKWNSLYPIVNPDTDVPVTAFWFTERLSNLFDYDPRLRKVKSVLTDSVLVQLATMLFESAIEFEYHTATSDDSQTLTPPMDHPLVQNEYQRAGVWFQMFARLPFDATYNIEALLDCLRVAMVDRFLE